MEKKEMIIEILTTNSCLTSKEIANFIWRRFEENYSPASISGTLRTMYAKGEISKGTNAKNNTIYWIPTEKKVII